MWLDGIPNGPDAVNLSMEVALVVHDFDRNNGQGRYCVELVRHLRDRCRFTVYSATADRAELAGVDWRPVPSWRARHLTTVFTFLAGAELKLRGARHDLVHAQGLSSWRADVITVHMVHAARLRRLPAATRSKDRLFSAIVTPLERAFYQRRRARHAIVMGRRLGAELADEYGWDRPLSVIPHGTDAARFRPARDEEERAEARARYGLGDEGRTWLFMGEAVKGLREVIVQMPTFPQVRLLVVTRSVVDAHRALARQLGVAGRITFHGFEASPELAFRAADALIYPSAYDPFGMVATEAMASGLPVVLGREMGAAELVRHGHDGLLCDPTSPESLREQLGRLEADPATATIIGRAARATIGRHSWEVCAESTWSVYQSVVENQGLSAGGGAKNPYATR